MTGIAAALAAIFASAFGWPVVGLVGGATALVWVWRRPGRAELAAAAFVLLAAAAGAARHEPPLTVPAIAWLDEAEAAEGVVPQIDGVTGLVVAANQNLRRAA